jgi:hypothetical protein
LSNITYCYNVKARDEGKERSDKRNGRGIRKERGKVKLSLCYAMKTYGGVNV